MTIWRVCSGKLMQRPRLNGRSSLREQTHVHEPSAMLSTAPLSATRVRISPYPISLAAQLTGVTEQLDHNQFDSYASGTHRVAELYFQPTKIDCVVQQSSEICPPREAHRYMLSHTAYL